MIFVNYPTVEYYRLPFKIIAIIMFLILAIKMIQIKKNTLNYLFCFAFLSWTLYLIADSIIMVTAANSSTWFSIGGILRDLTIITAMLTAFLIFLATAIVLKSEKALSKQFYIITFIICILLIILLIPIDSIQIVVNEELISPSELPPLSGETKVDIDFKWYAGLIAFAPTGIYIYAIVKLTKLTLNSSFSPQLKKRMLDLTIGIGLLAIGILYFVFLNLFGIYSILNVGGHILWTISPILIWNSQKGQEKYEPQVEEEEEEL